MKKLIAIMLLICIALSISACSVTGSNNSSSSSYNSSSSSSNNSNNSSSNSSSSSYNSSSNGELSLDERKKVAEEEAIYQAFKKIVGAYGSDYDFEATRYNTGAIDISGDRFTVYLTFYLYDKYGNYKKKLQAHPSIEVDKYGKVKSCGSFIFY